MIEGRLRLTGYGGYTEQKVYVVGQTPKRIRIRAITRTRLAGRNRWLEPGEEALVPTHAVLDNCEMCQGRLGGVCGNENIVSGHLLCDYCHADLKARQS